MKDTIVLWFTGLSGSGKSTIAARVREALEGAGKQVLLLDGDSIRDSAHRHLGFTPADIRENNRLIALRCKDHIGRCDVIIVSVITPFRQSRADARQLLAPHYVEVFVKTDLKICIERDVKGLYRKALAGEGRVIGLTAETPYEVPVAPDIVLDTQEKTVDQCCTAVMDHVQRSGRPE